MRTLNDLKIVLKYLDYILQNPKLALPLQCLTSRQSACPAWARSMPISVEGAFFMPRHIHSHTAAIPYHCALIRDSIVVLSNGIGSRFCALLRLPRLTPRCYERIDPVGHTTPRPSRDPHRSQIPGPVHNPVARTPRRNHAVPADGISHPHRRSRPLGNRGHVELAVVRHDGGCHAVAHAGRVVGCRPRLGSIGITDFNNGRR